MDHGYKRRGLEEGTMCKAGNGTPSTSRLQSSLRMFTWAAVDFAVPFITVQGRGKLPLESGQNAIPYGL